MYTRAAMPEITPPNVASAEDITSSHSSQEVEDHNRCESAKEDTQVPEAVPVDPVLGTSGSQQETLYVLPEKLNVVDIMLSISHTAFNNISAGRK